MASGRFLVLLLACACPRAEQVDSAWDRGLEIGGLVTLDHQSDLNPSGNPELTLKQVALEANVSVSPGLSASVTLKAEKELDRIFFDQAMASLSPAASPWTILFGHQTFNHGLLSTRLISDPDMLDHVEVKRPGISASYAWESLTPAAGLLMWETADIEGRASRDYAIVSALDSRIGPLLLRVSGLFSRFKSDVDLAVSLATGSWVFDAEGFTDLPAWDATGKSAGYYAGAEYQASTWLSLAVRHEGVAGRTFSGVESLLYGAGLTFNLKHDLFAAMEYSHRQHGVEAGSRLALQMGLKSKLNLPGFQRATLSRD